MKKILILYASAGSGHKKAAEAIFDAAKRCGIDAEISDIVSFMPFFFGKLYSDGYIFLIKYFPGLWGLLYFLSDKPCFSWLNLHFRKFANRIFSARLIAFLLEKKPDAVVSTQFLASEITAYAKLKLGLETKLITVVTDFGVHNFWINKGTDVYCCTAESTKDILMEKGVPEHDIRVTGVPLNEKFLSAGDDDGIISEFGLKKDMFTVLIMTGGIGAGPIEEIVELLKNEVQLLVICGNNASLFGKLSAKNYPNVKIFGFIDYVQKLMKISKVIITKAGGLSVTESLCMGLPMVFFFLIPGQESINAKTIEAQRAGFIATGALNIKDIILNLKNDPVLLTTVKNNALSLAKPDSTSSILSLVA